MMVRTTKQILRERGDCIHKDMLDVDNDMPLTDAYESKEWVCLSDLKKEIEEFGAYMFKKNGQQGWDINWEFQESDGYISMLKSRLCNSSEQKGDDHIVMTRRESVSGEHNTGEDTNGGSHLADVSMSSPVQNPKKKCTCPINDYIPSKWKKNRYTVCGRCGGAL